MKRQALPTAAVAAMVLAAPVRAADLPRRVAPPVAFSPVPVFTWTGAYAGLNAGYAWSSDRVRNTPADPTVAYSNAVVNSLGIARLDDRQKGFSGGGQIGYNYQLTPGSGLVVGVEADAVYTDLTRRRVSSATITRNPGLTLVDELDGLSEKRLDFLGTVRGRVGYAFDRLLVYGTGGFAYGGAKYSGLVVDDLTITGPAGPVFNTTALTAVHSDRIQTGYAYGGGLEYALPTNSVLNLLGSNAVTLKAEYLHYDLGQRTLIGYTVAPTLTTAPGVITKVRTEGDLVRAGLNFKFGGF